MVELVVESGFEMLRFCGFDLELTVDAILHRDCVPAAIYLASDHSEGNWLIVETDSDIEEMAWICAPISGVMAGLVSQGQCDVYDILRHSATGWVEVVRVAGGHAVPDQRVSCAELRALTPA